MVSKGSVIGGAGGGGCGNAYTIGLYTVCFWTDGGNAKNVNTEVSPIIMSVTLEL